MKNSLFVKLIKVLGVKYTTHYINKYYRTHPYHDSLYGLSQMCTHYSIENEAIQMDAEDTLNLDVPFITYINNEFAIVLTKKKDLIEIYTDREDITYLHKDEYIQKCSGITLLINKTPASCEPNYTKHHWLNLLSQIRTWILLSVPIIVYSWYLIFYSSHIAFNAYLYVVIPNILAALFSLLLIRKELNIKDQITDNICSFRANYNCTAVLNSSASKLFGILSWAEIGFSYFITNIFIILFFPYLLTYYMIGTLLAIPYTIWSFLYQKIIIKTWCPLCVGIQLLIWIIVIMNIMFIKINFQSPWWPNVITAILIYLAVLSLTSIIKEYVYKLNRFKHVNEKLYQYLHKTEIFHSLLLQKPFYDFNNISLPMRWGKINSNNILTVFLNPHCVPCAIMHNMLVALTKEDINICIQYVFLSENPNVLKFLMASYINNSPECFIHIITEWFTAINKEEFIKNYNYDLNEDNVSQMYKQHDDLLKRIGVTKTPTLMLNGHELPEIYSIKDLYYFI